MFAATTFTHRSSANLCRRTHQLQAELIRNEFLQPCQNSHYFVRNFGQNIACDTTIRKLIRNLGAKRESLETERFIALSVCKEIFQQEFVEYCPVGSGVGACVIEVSVC